MFNKKKKNEDNAMDPNAEDQLAGNPQDEPNENTAEITSEPTAEPVPELSAEEQFQQEKAELNDKYLRLFAEFDNYKRRTQKERIELLQTAGKEVIVSLLPVLDDFDRALKSADASNDVNAIKEGILLVQSKLKNLLTQKGLQEIESDGVAFNTDVHEAITNIPAPTDAQKGKVIDTMEKGYKLNDKVIRFAKVVVGS